MGEKYNYEKQHAKGKYHAFERIMKLVDKDSFHEIGSKISNATYGFGMNEIKVPYDGVITGFGKINGRVVGIYSQDFTLMGGSLGKNHGDKIANIIDKCIQLKCPVVGINDSGGARIQEGVHSLAGYGKIFYYNTKASGYIPQISIIAGPCAGGAVYSPGLTDFVFVIDGISNMFVTGPKVVKKVTYENVSAEDLGGAYIHSGKSGVAHFRLNTEDECYEKVKKLLDIIPHFYGDYSRKALSEYTENGNKHTIISRLPKSRNRSYDIKLVITDIVDKESFIEVQEEYAKNAVVGFARISNATIGIIANQPLHLAGVLDSDASDKIARFIRFCDSFDIPLVTLTDVPGYLPGLKQETMGIIKHGAKILYAYSEASVPKINIIIRKAYGGAYIAMSSKHLAADFVYAWPSAEIAVVGAEGAVDILYGKEIKLSENPTQLREEKIEQYNEQFMNPHIACEYGYIDEIIYPQDTREVIYKSLDILKSKENQVKIVKKHGNIPL